MRNRLIVSKTSIIAVILFLTQFVTLPYFAWYNVLKYMSIIIVGGYIITKYKCVIRRKYALINVLAFVFGGMLCGLPSKIEIKSQVEIHFLLR